jgi:hypothetical protein
MAAGVVCVFEDLRLAILSFRLNRMDALLAQENAEEWLENELVPIERGDSDSESGSTSSSVHMD